MQIVKSGISNRYAKVRDTEIVAMDTPQQYRQKLARIALDEMYQFVALLDVDGILLEVNRAALEGAGLKLSDVEGRPFWECFWWAVSKEIQDKLKASIARVAKGEFVRYDVEIYGRAGGKATIIIDFSMIPVKDDTGKVVFMVPEGRDITEKKAYEREVAQKNADLQALLERIRELDEIKTQFFANISHELRTPLALIIGPADRLLKPVSVEEQIDAAHLIGRNARMLLKVISDFDLLIAEMKVTINREPLPIIDAIPLQMHQLFFNLISNAIKFAKDGVAPVISITSKILKLEETVKYVNLSPKYSYCEIVIKDNGIGFKQHFEDQIFLAFTRLHGQEKYLGTGIGLALCKKIVSNHHGGISARSKENEGALFKILLPLTR